MHRPLVLVAGLTFGDYLLWNWSLNHNRDVLAVVSGLTLPPLVLASLWLLALTLARLTARSRSTWRTSARFSRRRASAAAGRHQTKGSGHAASPGEQSPASPAASATSSARSSRKIAA